MTPTTSGSKRLRLLSIPVIVFLVSWGQMTHGKPSVSGDGPHYLMVTQSLLADGDLDVANNYDADDGARFGADGLKPGNFVQATPSGRKLSVHDIGLSILVLPAYRVATAVAPHVPESLLKRVRMPQGLFAYSAVCLFMLFMTSVGWWLVARTLADFVGVWLARWLALLVALSPPLMTNGSAVFPEVPAFLVVSLVLAKAYGRERVPLWAAFLAAGLLPWLHRKFAAVAVGLVIVLIIRNEMDWRRWRTWLSPLAFAGIPTVALLLWTYSTWGSFGGPLTTGHVPLSWAAFQSGSVGMIFDREFGLVPWSPAVLLLPFAWAVAGRRGLPLLLPTLLLFVPAAAHDQWWGGWGPAGRFLVPAAPLAVMAVALMSSRTFSRVLAVPLIACQLVLAAWVWQRPRVIWNFGDGHNRLLESLPYGSVLQNALPSFATDPGAWRLGLVWVAGVALVTLFALIASSRPKYGKSVSVEA